MALNTLDVLPRKGMYSKYERPSDASARRKRNERRRRRQQNRQPPAMQNSARPPSASAVEGGMVLPSLEGVAKPVEGSMLRSVSLNHLQPLGSVGYRPDAADTRVEAAMGTRGASPADIFGSQVGALGQATAGRDPEAAAAAAADRVADQLLAQFSLERAGFAPTAAGAKPMLAPLSARSVADSVNSNAAEALADADRQIELLLQKQRRAAAGGATPGSAWGGQIPPLLNPLGVPPRAQQYDQHAGPGGLEARGAATKGGLDTVGQRLAAARVKQHLRRSTKQHRPVKNLAPPSPWVTTCGGKGTHSAGEEAAEAAAAAAVEEAAVAELLRKQGQHSAIVDAAAACTSEVSATPVLGSAAALEQFAASLSQQASAHAMAAREERRVMQAAEHERQAAKTEEQQEAVAAAASEEAARAKAQASMERRALLKLEFEKAAERRRKQEALAAAGGLPMSKAAKEVAKSVARRQVLLNMEAEMDRPSRHLDAAATAEANTQQQRLHEHTRAAAADKAREDKELEDRERAEKDRAKERHAKAEATRRRKQLEGKQSAQFLHQMEMEMRSIGDLHTDDSFESLQKRHRGKSTAVSSRGFAAVANKPGTVGAEDEDARTLREIDAKLVELEEFAVSTLRLGSPVEKEQRALAREEAAAVAAHVSANDWERRILADLKTLA
jgi:hypothetical protein